MLQRCLARSARNLSSRIPAADSTCQSIFRARELQSASLRSDVVRSKVPAARCYSAAAEAQSSTSQDSTTQAKQTPQAEDASQKELEAKKKEVVEVTDKWKRSIADYRNLQDQTRREVQAAKDFALQRFAKDLIDSIDNLDRALSTVPQEKLTQENKDLLALHDGLKMTEGILMQTLKKHGLERFDPSEKGDKFDPNRHEATFQVPQPDKEDGTVFHTQQKGFALNGRVLRAAKVGVVRNA